MNRENKYLAFTLVEMLIVMGIIVILMAVGIASGRFAIQRANKIEHQNAADQIYQALQSYYTDNREYPNTAAVATGSPMDIGALITDETATGLGSYIDEFDGGSDATYLYMAESTGQEAIVCVSLGGQKDVNELGYYCTGNGFDGNMTVSTGLSKDVAYDANAGVYQSLDTIADASGNDWTASTGTF